VPGYDVGHPGHRWRAAETGAGLAGLAGVLRIEGASDAIMGLSTKDRVSKRTESRVVIVHNDDDDDDEEENVLGHVSSTRQ